MVAYRFPIVGGRKDRWLRVANELNLRDYDALVAIGNTIGCAPPKRDQRRFPREWLAWIDLVRAFALKNALRASYPKDAEEDLQWVIDTAIRETLERMAFHDGFSPAELEDARAIYS